MIPVGYPDYVRAPLQGTKPPAAEVTQILAADLVHDYLSLLVSARRASHVEFHDEL